MPRTPDATPVVSLLAVSPCGCGVVGRSSGGASPSSCLAALFVLVLVCSRLLGVWPELVRPVSVLAVPLGAALLGIVLAGRTGTVRAARQVDRALDAHELFLSAVLPVDVEGDFSPLVAARAAGLAARTPARRIVRSGRVARWRSRRGSPASWSCRSGRSRRSTRSGLQAVRRQAQEREKRIDDLRRAVAARTETLREERKSDTAKAERALEELRKTLPTRPEDPEGRLKQLATAQKDLRQPLAGTRVEEARRPRSAGPPSSASTARTSRSTRMAEGSRCGQAGQAQAGAARDGR